VGMFVVPAVLGRFGYPKLQAAYAVNALYQIISFGLITVPSPNRINLLNSRMIQLHHGQPIQNGTQSKTTSGRFMRENMG